MKSERGTQPSWYGIIVCLVGLAFITTAVLFSADVVIFEIPDWGIYALLILGGMACSEGFNEIRTHSTRLSNLGN